MNENFVTQIANQIASRIVRNSGYLARQEIAALIDKIRTDPLRLEPFGFKVYSQNDEDGIIEEIMRRLKINAGNFCEIGVENGLECNSLYLIHKGWRGVWIEANLKQKVDILSKFKSIIPARLELVTEMVTADNINGLLSENLSKLEQFDFLSIDIDGNDIYLLEALVLRPKVICIEYNAKFAGNIVKSQVYDPNKEWVGTDYMGASLKAIADVAEKKGYQLVGTNIVGCNAFFVRSDLVEGLFCQNASSEYLYNPSRYWLFFDHFQNIGHRPDFGLYVDLK